MQCLLKFLSLLVLTPTSLAVSITKCKAEDSACMKQSAQMFLPVLTAGIPEFKVQSLDPLHIKKIDSSIPELMLYVNDAVVTGLKKCTVIEIWRKRTPSKHELFIDVMCNIDMQAEYVTKGKILLLDVDGSGHLNVQLNKVTVAVKYILKDVVKNGKTYWNVDHWDLSWDLKDRANIELKDLFKGHGELTKALRDMLSNNANEVIKETGPVLVKTITSKVVDNINNFFKNVPVEDLAFD